MNPVRTIYPFFLVYLLISSVQYGGMIDDALNWSAVAGFVYFFIMLPKKTSLAGVLILFWAFFLSPFALQFVAPQQYTFFHIFAALYMYSIRYKAFGRYYADSAPQTPARNEACDAEENQPDSRTKRKKSNQKQTTRG